jgi:RHS repeat-associated protein
MITINLVQLLRVRTKPLAWLGIGMLFLIGAAATPVQASVTVNLTAPADGTVHNNAPATIALSATASAGQGYTLSKVEFFYGGTNLIGTDTTSPFSFNWTNVPPGTYAITAKATAVKKGAPDETATSATATVIVNAPPSVSLTSPAPNAVLATGEAITLTASASDSDGSISKVDFYQGGTNLIATIFTPPYTTNWSTSTPGAYSITAITTDNRGTTTTSTAVPVTVDNRPTAFLTSPSSNLTTLAAPANITLTGSAADSDGTVTKVEFFATGAGLLATFNAPPYTFNWQNIPRGSYALSAVATDNQGLTSNPGGPKFLIVTDPPTVALTSPANNATFSTPANVTLTAQASDPDGSIQKVEFFQGSTLVATVTAAPYTTTVNNLTTGSYSFTAKATDNQEVATTSAPVSITVSASATTMYFIHTDHLNTPRAITNGASQVVWRWDHTEPFGADPANSNPSGLGAFEFNLRLPGQYFDKETNLHYNYFRDYDPASGRYVQSDPIGLGGDINPYSYVASNPLYMGDPLGLFKVNAPAPSNLTPYQRKEWERMVWALNFYGDRVQQQINIACAEDRAVLQGHFDKWVVSIDPNFFDPLRRRVNPITSFESQSTIFTWGFFAEKPHYQSEESPGRWFIFAHEFRHLHGANNEIYQRTIKGDPAANTRHRLSLGSRPAYEADADSFANRFTRSCTCGVAR